MKQDDKTNFHWSEQLAARIMKAKKEPYVISGGLTTSGPTHLGTVCEFLFPQALVDQLGFQGKKAKYIFVADIFDAFDSVPAVFEKYKKELEPHLGKPLTDVPDPTGKTKSFGDYFLEDAKAAMKILGAKPKIVRACDLYSSGAFDKYARMFLKQEEKVKELVAKSSLRDSLPDWWSPILPICEKCGKIATTRIISHDGENYEYACDRDVKYTKGCGFKGKGKISGHKYKLAWRLHWPTWMDYFNTSSEGAGIDHHTRGGSWETLEQVFTQIFKKEPPIGYRWGFILLGGKKYSKSKGTGMGIAEMVELLPPEIIRYMLFRPDLQENVDIAASPEKMLRTIEDFEGAVKLLKAEKLETLTRAERKKALAAKLSMANEKAWKTPFLDLLLYRQLQHSWDKIAQKTKDKLSIQKLSSYIEQWEKKKMVPEQYSFTYSPKKAKSIAKEFFSQLSPPMKAIDIHNTAFTVAKQTSTSPAELFKQCYECLLNKPKGPKLGKLIEALGIEKVKKDVL